jgi:acetate kinase
MNILVLNTGSSSLKFSLFESDREEVLCHGLADWSAEPARLTVARPGQPDSEATLSAAGPGEALRRVLDGLLHARPPLLGGTGDLAAVGH